MKRRISRSISVPITLAAVAVPLSIALLVGWTFLIVRNLELNRSMTSDAWLLGLGAASFLIIMVVLIAFAVFLAREILEVRRQDSFIDSVTHELKSPLASLKLCLQTLGRDNLSHKQRTELRTMMLEDVDRLSSFIDDILQASRLAHDRAGLALSQVDLTALVEQTAAGVHRRRKLEGSAIRVEAEPAMTVTSDRTALELVLRNLLDNAVKYSDPPYDVHVRANREGSKVVIEVEDHGIGVDPRNLKRIFHRFYRVSSESVRSRKGTGLGLFVVWALVRNLGGRVEARSAGLGQGTLVRVVLPGRRAKNPQQLEPSATSRPHPEQSSK